MDESFIFYKYGKHVDVKSEVVLAEANESNLNDLLSFEDNGSLSMMRKMFSEGEKGFLGYIDGKCVHRSWYHDKKGKVLVAKFLPYYLKENEVYIHACATSPDMRGKNIYPFTLAHIARINDSVENVYVATNTKNEPSKKGILKAGFIPMQEMRIKVILGFKKRYISTF